METLQEGVGLFKSIEAVFSTLDYLDDQMEQSGLNVEKCNNINLDFLHILETRNLSDEQLLNVAKAIVENQKRRREYKNQYIIAKTYKENKSKWSSREARKTFKNNLLDTVSHLGEKYNLKVLTEDEVEQIINKRTAITKSNNIDGRHKKRVAKPSKDKLSSLLKEYGTTARVAKTLGVSTGAINNWKRDYGLVNTRKKRGV